MAMKTFTNSKHEPGRFYMRDYLTQIGDFQKADLAFQANEFSRWEIGQKGLYIKSLIMKQAPTPFIFANVKECLKHAKHENNKTDIAYFKGWMKKGVKYLNIDSNNRNNVILEFIKGTGGITLPHGRWVIDGSRVVIDSTNDTYKTMPELIRTQFYDATIFVISYTVETRNGLSLLFRLVNDGKPLNHPEKLNSFVTVTANIIRELASKHGKYFAHKSQNWFAESARNRRGIDDFIAGCAFVYAKPATNISPKSLEDFYRDGSDSEQEMESFKKVFNAFMKDVMTENAYAIYNRNSILDLFFIYKTMHNDKRKINDNEEFLKAYMVVLAELLESKELHVVDGAVDPKSFETMIGGRSMNNNIVRNRLILEKFDMESLTTKHDKKRGFSPKDKMIMSVRSGFLTAEKKDIALPLLHTNAYHGGHVVPHSKGGETSLDNGVIQEAVDNLKLGANELNV